ncbi:MAG: GNAT family N-acetyltransferase [Rhodospirillales bacterium]
MNLPVIREYVFKTSPPFEAEGIFQAIWDIYVASIPASERKDRDALARMVHSHRYRVHIAEQDGEVTAFGIIYRSENHNFALLEYFATTPALRSQGIGGRLLDHVLADQGDIPVLLEVEAPLPTDQSGDSMESRRIGFYRRHGARMIEDFGYILPLKTAGTPPPMVILIGAAEHLTSISAAMLRDWLGDIYENVYGVDRSGAEFQSMFGKPKTAFGLR